MDNHVLFSTPALLHNLEGMDEVGGGGVHVADIWVQKHVLLFVEDKSWEFSETDLWLVLRETTLPQYVSTAAIY